MLPWLLDHAPAFVRRQALVLLFRATAEAFECDMPPLRGLVAEQCLLAYARFTSEQGEQPWRAGRDPDVQARLYRNAYRLGRMPGRLLRVDASDDVMALGRFLYGILDIDFRGSSSGDITIQKLLLQPLLFAAGSAG